MNVLGHIERDFVMLKVPKELIRQHQELFPDLKSKLIGPDATKRYLAFLTLLPFQAKKELTQEKQIEILKLIGVMK